MSREAIRRRVQLVGTRTVQKVRQIRAVFLRTARRNSVPFLRVTLGVVFIWFGALKVADVSPVADFVAHTTPWFDRAWFIPALGIFEVALGVALMAGRWLSLVCLIMVGHLCGTFLALVMQPSVTFQNHNLLLLTTEGEFVIKNLVLIAGAMVVAAHYELDEIQSRLQFQQAVTEIRCHLAVLRSLPPLTSENDLFS